MRKVLAILLTAMLLTTTLMSCSSSGDDAQAADSTSTVTEGEAGDASEAEAVELHILTPLLPAIQDLDTNTHTLWIQEQTGIDIVWETIPQAAQGGTEKLQLLLTGSELPDVFMNAPFTSDMVATYGVEEQILLPLDDYIGTYTPNLDAAMAEYVDIGLNLDQMRQTDGKIYSLPVLDVCEHCEYAAKMWYYEPFMTELGVDIPTTTDEFYDYLVAVRDNDVNGNGDATDEIPLLAADAGGWHSSSEKFLMNSFVYYNIDEYRGMYIDNGEIVTSLDQDGLREGLKYMNMLYEEGLLYSDSLTIDSAAQSPIIEGSEDPVVATVPAGHPGMYSTRGSERSTSFRSLAPLEGPEGVQYANRIIQGITGGYATAYILSVDCTNPEAAIEFADFMYTPENTLSVRGGLGLEGIGWEYVEGREAESISGGQAVWELLIPWNDTEPQNESWLAMGVWDYATLRSASAIPQGVEMYSDEGFPWMLYTETVNNYYPYAPTDGIDSIPPLAFTADEATKNSLIIANLFTESYYATAKLDFISGNKDIDNDADWQAFVDGLYANDYQTLIDNYQTAYDRQYAA